MIIFKVALGLINILLGAATRDLGVACLGLYMLNDGFQDVVSPRSES